MSIRQRIDQLHCHHNGDCLRDGTLPSRMLAIPSTLPNLSQNYALQHLDNPSRWCD